MSSLASVPAISYGESTATVAGNEAAAAGLAALAGPALATLDHPSTNVPTADAVSLLADVYTGEARHG